MRLVFEKNITIFSILSSHYNQKFFFFILNILEIETFLSKNFFEKNYKKKSKKLELLSFKILGLITFPNFFSKFALYLPIRIIIFKLNLKF